MWPMVSVDPPVTALGTRSPRETAFMRYFNPTAGPVPRARAGASTPLAAISPLLIAAVVNAEDPGFFDHHGIEWRSVLWVLRASVKTRKIVGGASTITQQLARNLYLTPTRSVPRKLREMWLAVRIDRAISKARTLELYLNLIEWGDKVWGCTAASEHYFHKAPADLTLFESTFLASIIAAPKAPVAGRNAARSQRRQLSLAHRLFLSGLATGTECAICCHRVWRLHHLLADGRSLAAAFAASNDVHAGDDGALLNDLAAALGLQQLDPTDWLSSHCGRDQQRISLERLRASVGDDVLLQVVQTHSYAALRDRLSHPMPRTAAPSS